MAAERYWFDLIELLNKLGVRRNPILPLFSASPALEIGNVVTQHEVWIKATALKRHTEGLHMHTASWRVVQLIRIYNNFYVPKRE